jgi:hypothetical protein
MRFHSKGLPSRELHSRHGSPVRSTHLFQALRGGLARPVPRLGGALCASGLAAALFVGTFDGQAIGVSAIVYAQAPAPAGAPGAPAAPAGQPAVQGTPAQDTARGATVLAEARKALGGEDRLKAVQRLEIKGKSAHAASPQFNIEGDFEIQIEMPDKYRRKESLTMGSSGGGLEVLQLLNGATASQSAEMAQAGGAIGGFDGGGDGGGRGRGGRGGANLAGLFGDGANEEATRTQLTADMARMAMALLLSGTDTVAWVGVAESPDGKADVLEFKTADGVATRLMVDTKTRMPLMMSWTGTPSGLTGLRGRGGNPNAGRQGNQGRRGGGPGGGAAPLQVYLSDYKTVSGIKLPHLLQSGANGETTEELVVRNVRINPSFRADIFQK